MTDQPNEHEDLRQFAIEQIKQRIAHIEGEMAALQRDTTDPRVARLIALLKRTSSFDELFALMREEGLQ